jgi:hypothetical protein
MKIMASMAASMKTDGSSSRYQRHEKAKKRIKRKRNVTAWPHVDGGGSENAAWRNVGGNGNMSAIMAMAIKIAKSAKEGDKA